MKLSKLNLFAFFFVCISNSLADPDTNIQEIDSSAINTPEIITESNFLQENECFPSCRSGYFCHDGQCKEKCNPPCPEGMKCNESGNCVPLHPVIKSDNSVSTEMESDIEKQEQYHGFNRPFFITAGIGYSNDFSRLDNYDSDEYGYSQNIHAQGLGFYLCAKYHAGAGKLYLHPDPGKLNIPTVGIYMQFTSVTPVITTNAEDDNKTVRGDEGLKNIEFGLLAQYEFAPRSSFSPFIGVGFGLDKGWGESNATGQPIESSSAWSKTSIGTGGWFSNETILRAVLPYEFGFRIMIKKKVETAEFEKLYFSGSSIILAAKSRLIFSSADKEPLLSCRLAYQFGIPHGNRQE
jgi:hypothetical protein